MFTDNEMYVCARMCLCAPAEMYSFFHTLQCSSCPLCDTGEGDDVLLAPLVWGVRPLSALNPSEAAVLREAAVGPLPASR
ncbi:hypothetical protein JZ751_011249 [Albula glossodonta]|uniref:Uncharacterized protein n=1 Tax=Albula glossodonta TaxID=121402 RepID=A0A8T2P7F5_9TELE|nr:hypothetical protein JZ751_011249 [Albula glossodonta]